MTSVRAEKGTRRGNAMVVGLLLGTLVGFSALSVDVGYVRVAQTQLQAAIDASALSGAGELDGTLAGISRAEATALSIAGMNPVVGTTLAITAADVEVGAYDDDAGTFTAWNGVDPADTVNAVVVDHQPPQFASILSAIAFGIVGYDLQAAALAVRPVAAGTAKSAECYLPFAIPDCWLAGLPPDTNPDPKMFMFGNSGIDTVAWGDNDGNPSTTEVRNQIQGQCDDDPIAVGESMYVNEGIHNAALSEISNILNDASSIEPTDWDTTMYGPTPLRDGIEANTVAQSNVTVPNWGHTLEGPVALVDAGDDCTTLSFTGTMEITGIAWAVIYDVKNQGNPKNVWIQIDVVNEHEIWGTVTEDEDGNVLATGDPTLFNL